jgi:hypothetical protein
MDEGEEKILLFLKKNKQKDFLSAVADLAIDLC